MNASGSQERNRGHAHGPALERNGKAVLIRLAANRVRSQSGALARGTGHLVRTEHRARVQGIGRSRSPSRRIRYWRRAPIDREARARIRLERSSYSWRDAFHTCTRGSPQLCCEADSGDSPIAIAPDRLAGIPYQVRLRCFDRARGYRTRFDFAVSIEHEPAPGGYRTRFDFAVSIEHEPAPDPALLQRAGHVCRANRPLRSPTP